MTLTSLGSAAATRSFTATALPKAALVLVASLFVAVCAHASVPLPFTPVPVVLSDFAVLLVGLVLGPTLGFAALCVYLLEGAVGLPVFSPFGLGGLAQLFGPTGGYLLAYPLVAALAGGVRRALQSWAGSFAASLLAAALATIFLLTSGAAWIGLLRHLSPATLWALAIFPFLAGAGAKVVAAAAISSAARQLRRS